jgi:hypothetical protein
MIATGDRAMRKRFAASEATRCAPPAPGRDRRRFCARCPAALASDQPYRESDLAIDFCEDVRGCRTRRSTA